MPLPSFTNLHSLLLLVLLLLPSASHARVCPPDSWYPRLTDNVTVVSDAEAKTAPWTHFRRSLAGAVDLPVVGGMGIFSSWAVDEAPGTGSQVGAAAFLAQGATSSPPFVSLATFHAQADYHAPNLTQIMNENPLGDVGAYASVASVVLAELVEFEDHDGDHRYTPGSASDVVLQTVRLYDPKVVIWDRMCVRIPKPGRPEDRGAVYVFNFSSSAGFTLGNPMEFSFQTEFSEITGVTTDYDLLTPLSVKLSVQVRNFPYQDSGKHSQLALGMYLALADASVLGGAGGGGGGGAITKPHSDTVLLGDPNHSGGGFLTWRDSTAEAGAEAPPHQVEVLASELVTAAAADVPGYALQAFYHGHANASVAVRKLWFTFGASQPSLVRWDPLFGAGPVPRADQSGRHRVVPIALWVIGLAAALAAAVLVARAVRRRFFAHRPSVWQESYQPIERDNRFGADGQQQQSQRTSNEPLL